MRTIVDIPEDQLKRLDADAKRRGISRAESVRRAVEQYLAAKDGDRIREAFGAWKHLNLDADKFLEELRDEWER